MCSTILDKVSLLSSFAYPLFQAGLLVSYEVSVQSASSLHLLYRAIKMNAQLR